MLAFIWELLAGDLGLGSMVFYLGFMVTEARGPSATGTRRPELSVTDGVVAGTATDNYP